MLTTSGICGSDAQGCVNDISNGHYPGVIMSSVDHVNTDDWTNGTSLEQVKHAAASFARFDAGTGRISLTCVRPLLHTMPQPLGFRDKQGVLQLGERERALERLIRSECNLIALENESEAKLLGGRSRRSTSLFKMMKNAVFGEKKRVNFSASIEFQQVMITLLAWRTPWNLSIDTKRQRRKLLGDVVYMTHALSILDFFKAVSASKAKAKMLQQGKSRGRFLMWARACPHFSRRVGLKNDWTIHFRRPGAPGGPMGTVAPEEILRVNMLKIPKLPKGTLLHREAMYWEGLTINPNDGINLFLRKIAENTGKHSSRMAPAKIDDEIECTSHSQSTLQGCAYSCLSFIFTLQMCMIAHWLIFAVSGSFSPVCRRRACGKWHRVRGFPPLCS